MTMTDVTYRTPADADAVALADLGRDTFTATFDHLYKPEDLAAFLNETFTPAVIRAQMADPQVSYRVAEADGRLVAFCKVSGVPGVPVDETRRAAELKQLYVRDAWHGTGVAAELMRWALDTARGLDAQDVYLSVYCDNIRAQRFYRRCGFEIVGSYFFMVGSQRDDERIMRANLEALVAA